MQTAPRRRNPSGSGRLRPDISSAESGLFRVSDHPDQVPPARVMLMMTWGSLWPLLREPSQDPDTLLGYCASRISTRDQTPFLIESTKKIWFSLLAPS